MANGIVGIAIDMSLEHFPMGHIVHINNKWSVEFNENGHGRSWVSDGWANYVFSLSHCTSFTSCYQYKVLAWDFPERIPRYVKQRIYRLIIANHQKVNMSRSLKDGVIGVMYR